MMVVHELADLRAEVTQHRRRGARIAFVPTMGNLHTGHLTLIDVAHAHADHVVASIYVNPMQFAAHEDLESYPRTPEQDHVGLAEHGTDLLFLPDDRTMYPRGLAQQTRVEVPGLGDILCGASRPGHFRGVATVVNRLFNMVQPDSAIFGKKDYQQLLVIRRMVTDLAMPVTIIGVETVRADDGLALSSRNNYLSAAERATAPVLYQSLLAAKSLIEAGSKKFEEIKSKSLQDLANNGFEPEYFEIRRQDDLQAAGDNDRNLVILAAAWLGPARLIDNLEVEV